MEYCIRFAKQLGFPILLLTFAAACAGIPGAQYPVTVNTPAGQELINFDDPAVKQAKTVRVSHRDAFEHVEYARFDVAGLTVEAVYDVSLNDGLVLEFNYWMSKMIDTWNVNSGQSKSWGARKAVRAWHGGVDYQLYRLAGGRECAGFISEWNYQPRDPFGRPSQVLFGYVCAKPGVKLPEQKVAALLRGISISERSGSSFVPVGARRQIDQVALNAAKGTAGSASGNAEFPFNFGTPYFEGDGGDDFGS